MTSTPVRVAVRVRPSLPGREAASDSCIVADPRLGTGITIQNEKQGITTDFTFNTVLGPMCGQHDVFETCGKPLVEAALNGQRACLFAYGQSGSGKTFSLLGAEGGQNKQALNGVVPLVVSELFRRVARMLVDGTEMKVMASYCAQTANIQPASRVPVWARYPNRRPSRPPAFAPQMRWCLTASSTS